MADNHLVLALMDRSGVHGHLSGSECSAATNSSEVIFLVPKSSRKK